MDLHRSLRFAFTIGVFALAVGGCATSDSGTHGFPWGFSFFESSDGTASAEQAQLFREAETERAAHLIQEIARLQTDLKTAEAALVEVESGLAGTHTRADAVSSIAVTRIQVERAESSAPWRSAEIAGARKKLEEAERQVEESRFGTALFFVYRARRVAESIIDEADFVDRTKDVRIIRTASVNLRSGPSASASVLSVLPYGIPVFPQAHRGDWVLVQVSGGPAGWIHRRLVGTRYSRESDVPAARRR